MKITSTKTKTNYVKALVYGDSGVGKTVLGSTAPNPIFISAERGLLSLADKDISVIEVDTLAHVEEAYQYLKKDKDFQTVVLDSLSEIAEVLLSEFKITEGKDARQAYGKMGDEMAKLTRKFRSLDKHVLFIAKIELFKDEFSGKVFYRPACPGQAFSQNIPYLFDEVFAMQIGKKDGGEYRYLQTQPNLQYTAKDRSGKLLTKEDPNLTMIFNKIIGDK